MLKKIMLVAMLSSSALIGGCAAGPFNGNSGDAMQMVVTWKNPDYGPMTEKDYAAVVRQANFCKQNVADKQLSSNAESMVAMGAAEAVAGGIGVGGGARAGGIGKVGQMGPYGAIAGGASGVVGGAAMHSATKAAVVGYCTTSNLSDQETKIPGVHAMGAYVRTKNHSGKLPSWLVPASSTQDDRNQHARDTSSDDVTTPPPPQPH